MLEDIMDFIKDVPKVIIGFIKDIFMLIFDLIMWIKRFVIGFLKLCYKLILNLPKIIMTIGKFIISIIKKIPKFVLSLLKFIPKVIIKVPKAIILGIYKILSTFVKKIPTIIVGSGKLIVKLVTGIPKLIKGIIKLICKIPVFLFTIIKKICYKIYYLFIPKSKNQRIFLAILLLAVAFGISIKLNIFSNIKFVTPQLVEGPKVVFFIPMVGALAKFPLAIDTGNGTMGLPVTTTVVTTWFIIFALFVIFKLGTRNLKIVPGKFQAILESIYGAFDKLVGQMMYTWKPKYFSYVSSLLLFIVFSNIITFFPIPMISFTNGGIDIAPAFRSPTADMNTTVGLALLTAVIFTAVSLKTNGFRGYVEGFLDPMFVMAPLNVVGEVAKPVNIALRLFGNMFAGMVIIGLLYMATTNYPPLTAVVAPLHLYFDLFSGVVQGFVFTLLTMVYINGSYGDRKYVPKEK